MHLLWLHNGFCDLVQTSSLCSLLCARRNGIFATNLKRASLVIVGAHFSLGKGGAYSSMLRKLNRDEWDFLMPAQRARRGRPRGSGLDDRASLRAVADLLDADPTLKPTTAIKRLGVTDPSTIRRLRDKFRQSRPDPGGRRRSDIGGAEGPAVIHSAPVSLGVPPGEGHTGGMQSVVWQETKSLEAWFKVWCAFGLQAFSATVEAHLATVEGILLMPSSASKQRASVHEIQFGFSSADPDVRSTVH